jgi:hypothetical protein
MPKQRVVRHAVTQPLDTSYRLIPLTQGKTAIVDADDFEWLSQRNWYAYRKWKTDTFYAASDTSGSSVAMHRLILGCTLGEKGDHENHNTLDNRRQNLRKCNVHQSVMNRRKHRQNKNPYKGIFLHPNGKWRAFIGINRRKKSLGYFDNPEDAAKAYDKAARIHFGQFACLNFPDPKDRGPEVLL